MSTVHLPLPRSQKTVAPPSMGRRPSNVIASDGVCASARLPLPYVPETKMDRSSHDEGARNAAGNSDAQDKLLMGRIAKGDEEALRDLIEKHQGAVYGTIAKMLGDPVEAQDLAQQVFVRVYRAAGSYRATAQFKTWMFTIVRNLVFNEHRRRSRATFVSLHPQENESGYSGSNGLDLPDVANKTPEENMLQREMLRKIDEAILALPEQQRLAIVLRRFDEFSYEEIAEILKTSVQATKSLLFRARETLRVALQDYLANEDGNRSR